MGRACWLASSARRTHVHRLVAVDDVGHPVGVLSSIDFVALYAEARS
jgi:hypothetical protein